MTRTVSGPMTTCTGYWKSPTNDAKRSETHLVQNGGPVCGTWINEKVLPVWVYEAYGADVMIVTCGACTKWINDKIDGAVEAQSAGAQKETQE